jgi:hypothetical protein
MSFVTITGLLKIIVIIMVRHFLEQNVLCDHNGLLKIIVIIMVRHFLEQNVLCDHNWVVKDYCHHYGKASFRTKCPL